MHVSNTSEGLLPVRPGLHADDKRRTSLMLDGRKAEATATKRGFPSHLSTNGLTTPSNPFALIS